jgi:hypothetical protein
MKSISVWWKKKTNKWDYQTRLWWNRLPDNKKKSYAYIGNYALNGVILSFFVYYLYLWYIPWVRYVFLVPALTVAIIYVEHYYKWFKIEYRDDDKEDK